MKLAPKMKFETGIAKFKLFKGLKNKKRPGFAETLFVYRLLTVISFPTSLSFATSLPASYYWPYTKALMGII